MNENADMAAQMREMRLAFEQQQTMQTPLSTKDAVQQGIPQGQYAVPGNYPVGVGYPMTPSQVVIQNLNEEIADSRRRQA